MFSNHSWETIEYVELDRHSRTSNALVRQLMEERSGVRFGYGPMSEYTFGAKVLIGDRVFNQIESFDYKYDLGQVWKEKTGMPFAFAVWVSSMKLPDYFQDQFIKALQAGIDSIDELVAQRQDAHPEIDLKRYLTECIDYDFGEDKKRALAHFLENINSPDNSAVDVIVRQETT